MLGCVFVCLAVASFLGRRFDQTTQNAIGTVGIVLGALTGVLIISYYNPDGETAETTGYFLK